MANPMYRYWAKLYQQTDAERAIEPAIAALGRRYRSQHPFWGMSAFADFALLDDRVIIEIDGDSHNKPSQKEKDLLHELQWSKMSPPWAVVRISNEAAQSDPTAAIRAAVTQNPPAVRSQEQIQADLDQLHQDFPRLLAEPATRPKRKSRPRKESGRGRKSGVDPRNRRAAPVPSRESPRSPGSRATAGTLASAARW